MNLWSYNVQPYMHTHRYVRMCLWLCDTLCSTLFCATFAAIMYPIVLLKRRLFGALEATVVLKLSLACVLPSLPILGYNYLVCWPPCQIATVPPYGSVENLLQWSLSWCHQTGSVSMITKWMMRQCCKTFLNTIWAIKISRSHRVKTFLGVLENLWRFSADFTIYLQ